MGTLSVEWGEDGALHLRGELDVAGEGTIFDGFRVRGDGQQRLVMDLSELTFIDSAGVRALMRVHARLDHRPLVLRSPQSQVRRVLYLVAADTWPNVTIEG